MDGTQVKFGNLTINVGFQDNTDPEFAGECQITLAKKPIKTYLRHYQDREIEEHEAEDRFHITNADCFIRLLRGLSELAPSVLNLKYFGKAYWFFHDLSHAENDTVNAGGIIDLTISSQREERALIDGAKNALKHNVPLSQIIRELIEAEKEFAKRWGYDTLLVEEFFEGLKVSQ